MVITSDSMKLRVFIVDDDHDLLRLLSIRLNAAGYKVDVADSGEAGLARLDEVRPHVIIADLRMGGIDGFAFFDAVRATHPSLPVIMLTAHGSIPEAVDATRRGVFSFLTKPFDSHELLAEVKRATAFSGLLENGNSADVQGWREKILTRSPIMEELLRKAKLAAASDASVLLLGDSGTGKELLSRAIHDVSARAAEPFVAVNCAAIPEQLLESELFGHRKGAFTGAVEDRAGLFKAAHKGTMFFDEVGDMPMSLQVKLLRVLQSGEFRPVGAHGDEKVDTRIISATNRDLDELVEEGIFREDLYYRLNVVQLRLPPLSERREDISLLAERFLTTLYEKGQKEVSGFSNEALDVLLRAPWPGNVRQLANVVEQSYALATSRLIPAHLVEEAIRKVPEQYMPLSEARRRFELDYLLRVMKISEGNVSRAAKLAGRNRTEFYKLLSRHHIIPEKFKDMG